MVRPERDHEAVALVDARRNSRLKTSHRALGFGEPFRELDFELCCLVRARCDPGKDITRPEAQDEPVRFVNNDRVVDRQVERCGGRHGRSHRTRNL